MSESFIDLRSDTITQPSKAMRAAMFEASVGDDVYGEDPTVNRLQERAAALLDKPAALFLPSGTMGNLVALMAHCGRGDAALVGDESHIYHYEGGGASVLGGVHLKSIRTQANGELALDDLAAACSPAYDDHSATDRLVCLENTHARRGGVVLSLAYMERLAEWARSRNFAVHLDGARLFNACTALGVSAAQLVQHVDSVQCCLSKGLGSPVGSVLAGATELVRSARRWRKVLGGGMRQAGIVAAAGMLALDDGPRAMVQDHHNARLLGRALAATPGVTLLAHPAPSNMVLFRVAQQTLQETLAALRARGVLLTALGPWARAVTHSNVTEAQCTQAAAHIAAVATGS